jgi:hypothetical protein
MSALIFGSPEANRIAKRMRFCESLEPCPLCGRAPTVKEKSFPSLMLYQVRCPDTSCCELQEDFRADAGGERWGTTLDDARAAWRTWCRSTERK